MSGSWELDVGTHTKTWGSYRPSFGRKRVPLSQGPNCRMASSALYGDWGPMRVGVCARSAAAPDSKAF